MPRIRRRLKHPGSIVLSMVLGMMVGIPLLLMSCVGPERAVRFAERISFKEPPKVRVALATHATGGATMGIRVSGPYRIIEPNTGRLIREGSPLEQSPVAAITEGLMIATPTGPQKMAGPFGRVRIIPLKPGTLHVGDGAYRGCLDIICNRDRTMALVNELDIEEYTRGVVAAEMPHRWSKEALRAQAVASRTYTLAMLVGPRAARNPDYDFEAGYLTSQEYTGLKGEVPSAVEAVAVTRGVVLTCDGQPFRAYFHSTCGGHTEACGVVWRDYPTIPPLAGVKCEYCRYSKWYAWPSSANIAASQCTFKSAEIEAALRKIGYDVGAIRDLQFTDTTGDGHADRVTVTGTKQTVTLIGNDFRLAVGSKRLPSLKCTVTRQGDTWSFSGYGFGHGVGMCQWGAKGMADEFNSYDRILATYYPGAELWRVYK